jgi:hypothetical protein
MALRMERSIRRGRRTAQISFPRLGWRLSAGTTHQLSRTDDREAETPRSVAAFGGSSPESQVGCDSGRRARPFARIVRPKKSWFSQSRNGSRDRKAAGPTGDQAEADRACATEVQAWSRFTQKPGTDTVRSCLLCVSARTRSSQTPQDQRNCSLPSPAAG